MSVIQVGILGVAGVLFAVQLKQLKAETAIYLCIAISVFICLSMFGHLKVLIDTIREISSFVDVKTGYITILLKMLGITYLSEFASSICKDAGYQVIAAQIELFGKISILVLSIPIMLTLLETVQEFLR